MWWGAISTTRDASSQQPTARYLSEYGNISFMTLVKRQALIIMSNYLLERFFSVLPNDYVNHVHQCHQDEWLLTVLFCLSWGAVRLLVLSIGWLTLWICQSSTSVAHLCQWYKYCNNAIFNLGYIIIDKTNKEIPKAIRSVDYLSRTHSTHCLFWAENLLGKSAQLSTGCRVEQLTA